jgi:lysophospholipase L1-like esterase
MSFFRAVSFLFLLPAVFSASCRRAPSGIIVLCAGDSLTEQGYPRYLKAALGKSGVRSRILNYGRSGNTSREYLEYLKGAKDKLRKGRPDFVLIELGTNDVRIDGDHTSKEAFEENLRAIVAIFQDARDRAGRPPEILLAAVPPVPPGTAFPFGPESPGRVTAEINPVVEAVSRSMKAGLVDNYSLFSRSPALLPGVHPSPDGYRAMAENWALAIRSRLPRLGR